KVDTVTSGIENELYWITGQNVATGGFSLNPYTNPAFNSSKGSEVYADKLHEYECDLTYSVYVMSPEPVTVSLGEYNGFNGKKTTLTPNKWTRISWTVQRRARPAAVQAHPLDNTSIPLGTKVYWKNYKIEKGNIATDYSLAPEDTLLESDFKSFQADYEQNAQGITSRLSSAENNITANNQAFTTFKENEYKRTADRVSDTFTKRETTTMLGSKADASQLSNYVAKSTYERDAEQSKERFETIESDLGNISVGGRNLLQKTSNEWKTLSMRQGVWFTNFGYDDNYQVEVGETYTFSII